MSRNIFANANRQVKTHSFGNKGELKKIDLMSDTMLANSKLREMQEAEYTAAMEAKEIKARKDYLNQKSYEAVVENSMRSDKMFNVIDEATKKCRTNVFKDIMFEMYYNALVLDEGFCEDHKPHLRFVTDKYIDDNGGFSLLENAVKSTNSVLLKRMKSICESTANEVTRKRLVESSDEDPKNIDFRLTQDEKEKLDFDKSEMGVEEISDLVKKKVLTVIQDEKNREESEGKIREDIENEITKDLTDGEIEPTNSDGEELDNLDDTKEERNQKDINESLNRIIVQDSPVETGTLFNALLHESYKEILAENIAIHDDNARHIQDDEEDSINYDIDRDFDEEFPRKQLDFIEDDEHIERSEINMDLILSESIAKYTLMELLYTIQMENYTYTNISKLTEKILNDKTPINNLMESKQKKSDDSNPYIETRAKFFKCINDLKDMKSIEKNKAKIINMVSDADPQEAEYYKGHINVAIKQIDDAIDKNPHFEEKYDGYIKWLKDDVTKALDGEVVKDDDKSEEEKVKEFWSNILN